MEQAGHSSYLFRCCSRQGGNQPDGRASGPIRPIQRPVLDGLAEMTRLDIRSTIEVCDRARYFQNSVCVCTPLVPSEGWTFNFQL